MRVLANLVFGQFSLLVKLVDRGVIVGHLGDRPVVKMVDAAVPQVKHPDFTVFP